ncbi:LysR substrate-binding domain-containing protein [Streptomyces sp. NPDC058440]|uniref:LysR substrate-binding domain-containing protein n=1 Tax=Streptomyces sp. NPDC058440 TaxID=3346501 RepID=UPI0036533597
MASVEVVDLPGLLGQLHARHPAIDVRLRLATAGSAGPAHALLSGDLDVAFLSLPERKPAGIDARELATVPLVLVMSAAHPLAQRGKVALADLAGEPFVDFPPGYGNREVVDRAFAAAGVVRRVALEASDIDMGAALVLHGLGIAFLPAFAVARTPGLHVLDVQDTRSAGACISARRRPGGRCSTSTSSPCDARAAARASPVGGVRPPAFASLRPRHLPQHPLTLPLPWSTGGVGHLLGPFEAGAEGPADHSDGGDEPRPRLLARCELAGSIRGRATHPLQRCSRAARPTATDTARAEVLVRHQPGPPSTIFHTRVATWRFSRSSTFARS